MTTPCDGNGAAAAGVPGRRPAPPPGGRTADDLDHLPSMGPEPDDSRRQVELLDGALLVAPARTRRHQPTVRRLEAALAAQAPADRCVVDRMDLRPGHRTRLCPDPMVVDAAAAADLRRSRYTPDEVHLVVEVVSQESAERDRTTKPARYAEAAIKHFRRVEEHAGRPVVHGYEFDETTRSHGPASTTAGRGSPCRSRSTST